MKILVTGGLGFIGSHTVVALLQKGHEVVIVDDLSNSEASVLDGIERIGGHRPRWHQFNICDTSALKAVLREEEVEGVIHFAAFKAVGESVERPLAYFENNVGGMLSLLQAMDAQEVTQLVFSSSCTVYGDTDHSPIGESEPIQQAASPYGTSKIVCEQLMEDLCSYASLRGISLRYFNPVGAHPSGDIGELPIGKPSNLVPFITQTAAGIHDVLTINGDDYPTDDGTNVRDYIHVVDLAEAHVLAVEYLQRGDASYEVFNLGTGQGSSVLDVIRAFEKASGLSLPYRIGPRRAGDVVQIWADPHKAQHLLGWQATRDLETMMRDAWNWQLKLKGSR